MNELHSSIFSILARNLAVTELTLEVGAANEELREQKDQLSPAESIDSEAS